MSAAVSIAIAEAVKDHLNMLAAGSQFAPYTFTAERAYAPTMKLEDLDVLHVNIVPKSKETSKIETRRTDRAEYQTDIGLFIRPPTVTPTHLDPLMLLVEQVSDACRFQQLAGATWVSTSNNPVYVAEHLREWKQFSSILTLHWTVVR